MADRFFIAPFDQKSGQQTNVRPWLVPDEAFETMSNAYVFRGRVRKRFGSRWLGNTVQSSRLRIDIGVTTGADFTGNLITILDTAFYAPQVGVLFTIGNVSFTVFDGGAGDLQMHRSDGSGSAATFNLVTTDINIVASGSPNGTTVYFYPALPVMGLLTYETDVITDEFLIGFDTSFAYRYLSGGWDRLANFTTLGDSEWTGSNSQFFWGTTYTGISASDRLFFVSNNNIPDGIRYYDGVANQWHSTQFYYQVDSTGVITNAGTGNAAGNTGAGTGAIGQFFIVGSTLFLVVTATGALTPISLTTGPAVGTGTYNITTGAWTFTAATKNVTVFWSDNNLITTALIIVFFKNRLLLFNTTEKGVNYPARVRWSQIGSPLDPAAWLQSVPGRGNALDASTTESITTVEFIRDKLIVFFENSTWELVATGNQAYPFSWQKINTELGAESTFSIVPFDKVCIGVGNVGIHECTGTLVERIDDKIPNAVFDIHNADEGIYRIYGIRDYFVEMVYWTFPDTDASADFPYPNRVLVYNYKTGTWAFNDDSITVFGYYQPTTGITWDSTTITWDDDASWDSGAFQAHIRQVIAGNQEGFTFICDTDIPVNAPVLSITNLTVGANNVITITAIDHNMRQGEYLLFQDITGTGNLTLINNNIFMVINSSADPITSDQFSFIYSDPSSTVIAGTYSGGGLMARISKIDIKTKEYNFYADKGRNAYISKVDFMVDVTDGGQLQVEFYVSTTTTPQLIDSAQNGSLLGTGTLDTFAYFDTIPSEETASRVWHPVYFQADGEVVQFQLTMNDEQMRNAEVAEAQFQLHAMCIFATPTTDSLR